MVKWRSLPSRLDQQPTTPAIGDTFSAMETAPALVTLMESGMGAHHLVNVSELVYEPNLFGLNKLSGGCFLTLPTDLV